MRIAMLAAEYPPKWGGTATIAYYLSNVLAEQKHEIHVITRQEKGEIPRHVKNVYIHSVKWLHAPLFFTLSYAKNAIRKLNELGDFDVVHAYFPLMSIKEKWFEKIKSPLVSDMLGSWKGERGYIKNERFSSMDINDFAIRYLSQLFEKYEKLALMKSDVVITLTNFCLKELNEYGVKRDMVVVPGGVDTSMFRLIDCAEEIKSRYDLSKDDNLILYAGRLVARKGVEDLLVALGRVCKEKKNTKLILVGRGGLKNHLQKIALRLGISNNIIFTGQIPINELIRHYAGADVFVLPSYYEGQGLVLLESMACGTPVVATRVGGIPEVVTDGENGLLVEPRKPEQLADAILKIINDTELRIKLGKNGRETTVKNYDWKVIAEKMEKIYESVTA